MMMIFREQLSMMNWLNDRTSTGFDHADRIHKTKLKGE